MPKERRLRIIDAFGASAGRAAAAAGAAGGSIGGGTGNADTVDGLHASPVPVPGYLLALDSSSEFPMSTFKGRHLSALVLSNDDAFTNERRFVAGAGLSLVDTGAGGTATLNVGQGAGLTVSADAISLTTPGTLTPSTANSSSGNHTHAAAMAQSGDVSQVSFAANSTGSAARFAYADHRHQLDNTINAIGANTWTGQHRWNHATSGIIADTHITGNGDLNLTGTGHSSVGGAFGAGGVPDTAMGVKLHAHGAVLVPNDTPYRSYAANGSTQVNLLQLTSNNLLGLRTNRLLMTEQGQTSIGAGYAPGTARLSVWDSTIPLRLYYDDGGVGGWYADFIVSSNGTLSLQPTFSGSRLTQVIGHLTVYGYTEGAALTTLRGANSNSVELRLAPAGYSDPWQLIASSSTNQGDYAIGAGALGLFNRRISETLYQTVWAPSGGVRFPFGKVIVGSQSNTQDATAQLEVYGGPAYERGNTSGTETARFGTSLTEYLAVVSSNQGVAFETAGAAKRWVKLSPTGDILVDPDNGYGALLPVLNDSVEIGSPFRKFHQLHVSELWAETLVAEDRIATVGGRLLVAPTTRFARATPVERTTVSDTFTANQVFAATPIADPVAGQRYYARLVVHQVPEGTTLRILTGNGTSWSQRGTFPVGNESIHVLRFSWTAGHTQVAVSSNRTGLHQVELWVTSEAIHVEHNQPQPGDILLARKWFDSDGPGEGSRVEYFEVEARIDEYVDDDGEPVYVYRVKRDLDGSGPNAWAAGDALVNTGVPDTGVIDLYSTESIQGYALDYVFTFDNSTLEYSENLAQSHEVVLFPDPPETCDVLYLGMDGGKWENLNLYLLNGMQVGAGTRIVWYYWRGDLRTWQSFEPEGGTVEDWSTPGVKQVRWNRNALVGWAPVARNNRTAYWIAAVLDPCNDPQQVPVHVGRRIYRGKAQTGPTVVGWKRNTSTYNDVTEHWALGNLDGLYGISGQRFGVALGRYSPTTAWLSADDVEGIRIMRGDTLHAQWRLDGAQLIGQQTVGAPILAQLPATTTQVFGGVTQPAMARVVLGTWGGATSSSVLLNTANIILEADGDGFIGSQAGGVDTRSVAIISNRQTYNGELLGAGSTLFGSNSATRPNILIDADARDNNTNELSLSVRVGQAGKFLVSQFGDVLIALDTGRYFGENGQSTLAVFNRQAGWNGETMLAGTILLGTNAGNSPNLKWDPSSTGPAGAPAVYFRAGRTAFTWLATDGRIYAADGRVFIDGSGLTINTPDALGRLVPRGRFGKLGGLGGLPSDAWGIIAGDNLTDLLHGRWMAIGTHGVRINNLQLASYQSNQRKVQLEPNGTFYLGEAVGTRQTTSFMAWPSGGTWGGEAQPAGTVLIGNHAGPHLRWNPTAGQFEFRYSTTVNAYTDSNTGKLMAGQGTVWLDPTGIGIRVSTQQITLGVGNLTGVGSLRFWSGDSPQQERGRVLVVDDPRGQSIFFAGIENSGRNSFTYLRAGRDNSNFTELILGSLQTGRFPGANGFLQAESMFELASTHNGDRVVWMTASYKEEYGTDAPPGLVGQPDKLLRLRTNAIIYPGNGENYLATNWAYSDFYIAGTLSGIGFGTRTPRQAYDFVGGSLACNGHGLFGWTTNSLEQLDGAFIGFWTASSAYAAYGHAWWCYSTDDERNRNYALVQRGPTGTDAGHTYLNAGAGGRLHFRIGNSTDGEVLLVGDLTPTPRALTPRADNNVQLGGPTTRWTAVYSVAGTLQTSSAEYKTDLEPIDPEQALAVATATPIYRYRYVGQEQHHCGFLAEEADPLLVCHGGLVNPQTTASVALAAIQALTAQVAALQAELAALKGDIDASS
mgnify:CR=1 FL=1